MTVRTVRLQRILAAVLLLSLLSAAAPEQARAQGDAPAGPPLDAPVRAAVLLDVHTGKVLYAKNEREPIPPASLAKIMTMLLALEAMESGQVGPDDRVTVSEAVWRLSIAAGRGEVSAMYLDVGQQVRFGDLLYGVGVVSGNDASLAVAEHLAGSEAAFVERMNRRAKELGLADTVFVDSHGLSAEARTTALDMARLAAHFVREHHDDLHYASRHEFTWNGITQQNRNRLLFQDRRVTGLKTGHLGVAGYHLVATAEADGMSLVAAVLGACGPSAPRPCDGFATRERAARQLLDYGFRRFATVRPDWGEGGAVALPVYRGTRNRVQVRPERPPAVTVERETAGSVAVDAQLPRALVAPLRQGQAVGTLVIRAGDREEARIPLVVAEDVPRGGLLKVVWDSLRLLVARLFGRA